MSDELRPTEGPVLSSENTSAENPSSDKIESPKGQVVDSENVDVEPVEEHRRENAEQPNPHTGSAPAAGTPEGPEEDRRP